VKEEVAVTGVAHVLHVQNTPKLSAVHTTTQLLAQAKHPDLSRVLGKMVIYSFHTSSCPTHI